MKRDSRLEKLGSHYSSPFDLIRHIWPSNGDEDTLGHISNFTKGQQIILSLLFFIREVDNGGFEQFLWNSSGQYTALVIQGLELIGDTKRFNAVKEAIKIFPNSNVPVDHDKRQALLKTQFKISELKSIEYFEEYNEKLYGEGELSEFMMKYIDSHTKEFYR